MYMLYPRLSVAPMLDLTDRHCRYLLRILAPKALLYTEMIPEQAIWQGKLGLLRYHQAESPLALQVGGSNPEYLAKAAIIAEQYHFNELNLNVGCPSPRVQKGAFGACLMQSPERVAECIRAMRTHCHLPVTIKTRLGIDHYDDYAFLKHFIDTTAAEGCKHFIIHARKAWLHGLSPKENRTIPPLHYDRVYRLKQDFPELTIILNGGLTDRTIALKQLQYVDGIMIGREAYHNPYFLACLHQHIYQNEIFSRQEVLRRYNIYMEEEIIQGTPVSKLIKPLLGLFNGLAGARKWRRYLSENNVQGWVKARQWAANLYV